MLPLALAERASLPTHDWLALGTREAVRVVRHVAAAQRGIPEASDDLIGADARARGALSWRAVPRVLLRQAFQQAGRRPTTCSHRTTSKSTRREQPHFRNQIENQKPLSRRAHWWVDRRLSHKPLGSSTFCKPATKRRFRSESFHSRRARFVRLRRSHEVGENRRCRFRTTALVCATASRAALAPPPLKDENPWCRRAEAGEAWCGS